MIHHVDSCLRIADPLDDARLFDLSTEPELADRLLQAVIPDGETGSCILAPPLYYQLGAGLDDLRKVNDFIMSRCTPAGPAIAGLGTVEPKYGDVAKQELKRIASMGACGVLWSPRAQGLFGDDATLAALHRLVHDLGMISVYRSEPYSQNEALWRGWVLARACPEVPLLISGALSSWDNVQMVIGFDGGPANVLYDTAMLARTTAPASLVAAIGAERLLFASGGTEASSVAASRLEGQLRNGGISDADIDAILSGNAVRLFKLAGKSA